MRKGFTLIVKKKLSSDFIYIVISMPVLHGGCDILVYILVSHLHVSFSSTPENSREVKV